MNNSVSDSRPG